MSDSPEKLQRKLDAAQVAITELQAKLENRETENRLRMLEAEENRSALLFMLEDLEASRKKVEQAHQEWMAALDTVDDPIFLHDKEFRVLRCNKAYQQRAGIPFHGIIGRPYYEIFPKAATPLPCCLRAMEKAEEEEEEEEEVLVGETIYRSRSFSVHNEQGAHLYSVHVLEDITESRRIMAALHESEEKFRKIGESAQDAIIMMDADKRISFWNAAAGRIFGYTAAEALGQELHPLIVPAPVRAAFERAFPHFQASGEGPVIGKVIEVTALHKGGEEFPAELSISATQLNGQWHAIGIVRDITERKQAEEKVVKEKEKFRMLFDAISDTVVIHDMNGRFLQVNRSACEHFGYSREELLQKTVADIDTPEFAARVAERIKVLHEQGRLVTETAHIHRDGTVIPVELSARIIDYGGQTAVLSVARDITERKQAETELLKSRQQAQYYLDIASVMLVSLDAQGKVQLINRKGCEMLGYSEADILGKDWFDNYLPEPVRKETRKAFDQIMDGDIAFMEYHENEILTSSGDTLMVAWHNATLLDESGKINGVLSSGEDITERKLAEDAIQHANRALATLSAVNRSLVRASSKDEFIDVDLSGHRPATRLPAGLGGL